MRMKRGVSKLINRGGRLPGALCDERGSTMVEMLMVVALLALFGVTICSLIISGLGTYTKISDKREAMVDGRIAMSFLNVRIRQNDRQGSVSIAPCPVTGTDALRIAQVFEEDSEEYVNWIYFHEGVIYESLLKASVEPTLDSSNAIVEMEDFTIGYKDGNNRTIEMTGSYMAGDKLEHTGTVITLRSDPPPEGGQ